MKHFFSIRGKYISANRKFREQLSARYVILARSGVVALNGH